MSRENVDLVRWAFTSDPTRFFSLIDDEIELQLRNGLLWRGRVYLDPREALEAVGLQDG